ncbi:MAG: thymidylate kinase [Nanoarchaeota archaeon]|nr:thymidylate kinase [Nanoarchaeota archaeon]
MYILKNIIYKNKGGLITFEGGEASGKTTQINMLEKKLLDNGYHVLKSREPGGVEVSEKIRCCLLKPEDDPGFSYAGRINTIYFDVRGDIDLVAQSFLLSALSNQHLFEKSNPDKKKELGRIPELYLFMSARRPFYANLILPHIKKSKKHIAISDRSGDSSRCYQGFGYNPTDSTFICLIDELNNLATFGTKPDLTLLLDLAPDVGLSRTTTAEFGKKDRIEQKPLEYHLNVRNGYLQTAREESYRMKIILYQSGNPNLMHNQIMKHVTHVFKSN